MKRTAFVTGAAGFLGRHLVEELSRRDWDVTALCLVPTDGVEPLRRANARVVFGNIVERPSLVAAMPNAADAIFHVAANTSSWSKFNSQQYQDNVVGTEQMIEVALHKSAKRFVYTSSITAYGYHPGVCIDENTASNAATSGINYGKTKFEAERLLKQATARGLSAVILNPVNILGPYDRNNWTRQLIQPVAQGKMRVVPPGKAMWAYVKDIVDAHISAVDRGSTGENYLLGGVDASFKEVINEIQRLLGQPLSTRVAPKLVLYLGLCASTLKSGLDGKEPFVTPERYKRAIAHIFCNDDKARRVLGYGHTPLTAMLQATIDWLIEERLLQGASPATPEAARNNRMRGVESSR
jgi:nucleoside-diphosphate-sugar epimerase